MGKYFIKEGYKINKLTKSEAISYIDKLDVAKNNQWDVYKFAKSLCVKYKIKNVLDIGCGIGIKLKELIYPICWDITGIDSSKSNIEKCKRYDFGEWYLDDTENPKLNLNKKFDLVISADVIEHLFNPDKLLNYVKSFCSEDTLIIISTPERDLLRGKDSFGPPPGHHIREWNKDEFNKYLRSRGFIILDHFLVDTQKRRGIRNLISKFNLDGILQRLHILKRRYKAGQIILCKCNL